MELKNITPFESFKRIYEEAIPSEFSNGTGFKESLVGRAMFGILRYFKKGIDLGRLEYYKRKLENEYFAAILRFCASRDIDLKTGVDNSSEVQQGGGQTQNDVNTAPDPYEFEFCEILANDYLVGPANTGGLNQTKQTYTTRVSDLNNLMRTLTEQSDKDDCQKLIDEAQKIVTCCDAKLAINPVFANLSALSGTTDPQISVYLDQIKAFLESDPAKYCSTYKGTNNEKNLIKSFSASTDQGIKSKADEVSLLVESYSLIEMISEKITSGINKSVNISQMLGDTLNVSGRPSEKVNIWKYLKSKEIESVDDINFIELVKLFKSKPQYQELVSSDNFLNYAGIRKIQYAVSDGIIFHVKKTPDNVGINPGTGGGTQYDEDTSMRKVWEKKVEFVKSEFSGFFDFAKVDPFVLLNLSDAMRERGKYVNDPTVRDDRANTRAIGNTLILETNASKMGLKPKGDSAVATEKTLLVFSLMSGGKTFYPVLSLCGTDGDKARVYRYVGNINFNKIITDKEYEKPDYDTKAKDYSNAVWETSVKTGSDTDFLSFLRIPGTLNGANADFDSIYITTADYDRIGSRIDPSNNSKKLRFLFNFIKKNNNQSFGQFNGPKNTATSLDFDLKCLVNGNNALATVNMTNVKDSTRDKLISFTTGEIFEILPGWEVKYFPDGGVQTVSKYKDLPYINKLPYEGKIILKP